MSELQLFGLAAGLWAAGYVAGLTVHWINKLRDAA